MEKRDDMKIGRYRTWIENGTLKLYGHEVGAASSTICSLDAEEAMGLLEMLSQHREEFNQALYLHESQHALQQQQTARW
ncbi:hypothetical protein EPA93_27135 [Ktedonosporobacter rubrisoli]|uniref:Uncharacterized protein n=1 Tax=Ktedonosporobacter rubrisoli TaxID=2509675 RepID=A0A4P6JUX4_KTERU|nr:hypothetical protein [Ktedonosporobacter rubrisoli]QBD79458.1 hypothetical protein EPA93_27135 [Ktedonosporobacter rubrisoli]